MIRNDFRSKNKGKFIPLDVLDSQMKSFENVKHDEGHNSLNIVDEFDHDYVENHGWLIE